MWGFFLYLAILPGVVWAQLQPSLQPFGTLHGTVVHVADGDTLRLNTGHTIRLLDINTPEIAHDDRPGQPYGETARTALQQLVLNRAVEVRLGGRVYDPYDRVLGHVFLRNGSRTAWVNGGLVQGGFAHVYTFPDNRVYGPELLALEDKARAAKVGLWSLPNWQVRDAATCCADADIGRFVLVEGTVQNIAKVKNRTYLNFGPEWRTDFTVAIDDKQEKFFRPKRTKGEKRNKKYPPFNWNDYLGQRVRVRGVAQPVNGVLIRVTHPEQLQIVR